MISEQKIELSVIVCTRNRARQLATLIQCLGSQKDIETLGWEIIIVDNNSTDNTKEVAYAFCEGSNLKINYLYEEKTGLSYARNTGILASKGSYLLFVDDDVLVPKEFISNAFFGIKEFPEYDIFGYKVLADWDEVKKAWLRETNFKPPFWLSFKKPFPLIQSFLPVHDLGSEVLHYPNSKAKNPIGACFLVKKEVFEKLGPFREDLGVGQSGLCEDTEFFWWAMINSFKILYWPYASIYHTADPKRLTPIYLHKWYFNLGKSLYLIKSKGRIKKYLEKEVKSESHEVEKLIKALRKQDTIFYLLLKLIFLILLLPLAVLLLLIKRPFYFSTLLAKTYGEIARN